MRLDISGSNLRLPRRTRAHVERRVRFALSRFGERVGGVQVRLSSLPGPEGRDEQVCRAVAWVRGAPPVVVAHHEAEMEPAVDHAVDRLARQVALVMERLDGTWTTSEDR